MAEKPTDLLLAEDLQIAIRTKGQTLYPVNRLTLRIPSHTVVGLVGESGCGKSMEPRWECPVILRCRIGYG